jgi:protoporphyrinogen oxidase
VVDLKYVILGAGPSGLTIAHALLDQGVPHDQLVVLEKEGEAGGLCRSQSIDGSPLDIGGGHFLDVKRRDVLEFLFRFLPEDEWNRHTRISRISLPGKSLDYPLEANLWQLDQETQVDYLVSVAQAGCIRGDPEPAAFADWIRWKFGQRIAEEYMLPYNRKIWSIDLNRLGTYWLHKLPDVSFREILQSCLTGKPFGSLPAHGTFLYPKRYGYGEVWRRMGDALGRSLVLNCEIDRINLATRTINDHWRGGRIINTIPWPVWCRTADLPEPVRRDIECLEHVSIDVDYVPRRLDSPAHWIYEPDESLAYHRLLLRANFFPPARGYWTETNSTRAKLPGAWRYRNEYAYPVNTLGKPEAVQRILAWARSQGVVGLGRWGTWEHMNSDVAVSDALRAALAIASTDQPTA